MVWRMFSWLLIKNSKLEKAISFDLTNIFGHKFVLQGVPEKMSFGY